VLRERFLGRLLITTGGLSSCLLSNLDLLVSGYIVARMRHRKSVADERFQKRNMYGVVMSVGLLRREGRFTVNKRENNVSHWRVCTPELARHVWLQRPIKTKKSGGLRREMWKQAIASDDMCTCICR
jgi:hypothetical protein